MAKQDSPLLRWASYLQLLPPRNHPHRVGNPPAFEAPLRAAGRHRLQFQQYRPQRILLQLPGHHLLAQPQRQAWNLLR